MFIPFEDISPVSRVWVYQSDRKLSDAECSKIEEFLTEFSKQWTAHNQELKASFAIKYHQFVLLAADEAFNSTSGCSIDDSVRAVKHLETVLGNHFFDRNQVAFLSKDEVVLIPLKNLKEKYQDGTWNENTLTFNNLVDVKSKLSTDWLIPAGKIWLMRYVPSTKLAL